DEPGRSTWYGRLPNSIEPFDPTATLYPGSCSLTGSILTSTPPGAVPRRAWPASTSLNLIACPIWCSPSSWMLSAIVILPRCDCATHEGTSRVTMIATRPIAEHVRIISVALLQLPPMLSVTLSCSRDGTNNLNPFAAECTRNIRLLWSRPVVRLSLQTYGPPGARNSRN